MAVEEPTWSLATTRVQSPAPTDSADVPPHKLALADSIRRLVNASLFDDSPEDVVFAVAHDVDALTTRLESARKRTSTLLLTPSGISINNAVEGRGNPLAPPLTDLHFLDGEAQGNVRFAPAAEGPPGLAHGGLVAAVLDHIIGRAVAWHHRPGMTGSLTVDYRAGTPLNTDLKLRARVVDVDGRKVRVTATVSNGDVLCAEASALLITVRL